MLFRTTLPSLVLLLFLLVTLVHADIDKKFEKFFRDRHDLDRGGSSVTVRQVTIDVFEYGLDRFYIGFEAGCLSVLLWKKQALVTHCRTVTSVFEVYSYS